MFALGCREPAQSILNTHLDDGRIIREAVAPEQPIALLVYSAATCFACGTPLPSWRRLANEGRIKLVLVLAGPTTDGDRRALRIQRIPVAGFVSRPLFRLDRLPSEYLLVAGRVFAKAEGAAAVQKSRLWKRVSDAGVGGGDSTFATVHR
jgi:hypothetical protein